MANSKSSLVQIAQDVLDEATQSYKVNIVAAGGAGGIATEATLERVADAVESIDSKTPASPATSVKQDTGNASLASIDSKLDQVDTDNVTVVSSVLPTGAATSANQTTANTSLSSLDGKTPALGQALAAGSVPVVLTAAQLATLTPQTTGLTDTQLRASPVPVSISTVPLPSGAATEATLASLNGKVTAVNTGAVVVSSSALPSGAATETTLSAINTKTPALGQALAAASVPVVLTSAQLVTLTPQTNALTDTQLRATAVPVSAATLPLPSGASTAAKQPSFGTPVSPSVDVLTVQGTLLGDGLPINNSITQVNGATVSTGHGTASGGTQRVAAMLGVGIAAVSASNPVFTTNVGRTPVNALVYTAVALGTSFTSALSLESGTTLASQVNYISVFSSTGTTLKLTWGGASPAINNTIQIPPGGLDLFPVLIPSGSDIRIRSQSGTSDGEVTINFLS